MNSRSKAPPKTPSKKTTAIGSSRAGHKKGTPSKKGAAAAGVRKRGSGDANGAKTDAASHTGLAARRKVSGVVPKVERGGVLVTGATGFLGAHLTALLSARVGEQGGPLFVRALARRTTLQLEKLGVEVVQGDVCDPDLCAQAVEGVHQVYHAAGFVSRSDDDASQLYKVHVDGTRTLLSASLEAGVQKVVVVSTSGTLAVSRDPHEVSDEQRPYRHSTVARWPYYLSKIYQEQTALQFARDSGLDLVVVNPSLLLGPGDERVSSTEDVERVVRGRLPVIPKGGGIAFVDARDAAVGCVLAMEKGRSGERYLLSAANMQLETFFGRVARLAGVPSPRPLVSPKVMKLAGRIAEAVYRRFDAHAPLSVASVEMAEHTWYVDSTKAEAELGFQTRDPQQTLLDTVRDIQRRCNLCSSAGKAA